jgi:cyanophycinase
MNFAAFLSLFFCTTLSASTLVLIGGGKRPAEALEVFVATARPGPLVILPWGTDYPEESFQAIKRELKRAGAVAVKCLCSQQDWLDEDEQKLLGQAGGVYFPGGDQNKIMQKIERFNLRQLLTELYQTGVPVAGTSAGTAIQSEVMLTGDQSRTSRGLGLLPSFILDQHFLVREREGRLLAALNAHTQLHGLGIDEDMSVVVTDGKRITALGPSSAVVYFRRQGSLEKIQLQDSDSFDLD